MVDGTEATLPAGSLVGWAPLETPRPWGTRKEATLSVCVSSKICIIRHVRNP